MLSAQSILVASGSQVSSELADEVVVLDLGLGVYHGMNAVAARAWSLVQQPNSLAAVRDQLGLEYDVEPKRCEADLIILFGDLEAKGLLECGAPAAADGV